MRRAVASLSPVSITTSTPRLVERRHGLRRGRPGRVGDADHADGAPVDGDEDGGAAALGELVASRAEGAEVDLLLLHEAAVADGDAAPVDRRRARRARACSRTTGRATWAAPSPSA